MSATWFTADLHLGHEKVARLRGFVSAYDHDGSIFETWERQVKPGDRVFVLGDISGGQTEEYALNLLEFLPGEKHLIAGNHDSVSSIHRHGYKSLKRFLEVFVSVRDFARIRSHKTDILLSHYPYAYEGDGKEREGSRYEQFRLPSLGAPLVHGHTHSTVAATDTFQYCVSWDAHQEIVPFKKVEEHFFGAGRPFGKTSIEKEIIE